MSKRVRRLVTAIAAIAALATSGAVIAQAQNSPAPKATSEAGQPENAAPDTDNVQDENGKDDASEGSEGSETADRAEKPRSEVAGDDGPGGHADEPGDPNADHQFQGKE